MTNYYIDSVGGDDAKDGKSEANAWKTFTPLEATSLSAGDTVNLKRGSDWDDQLDIDYSGSSGSPITIQPYGVGVKPIIRNTAGGTSAYVIDIGFNKSYVTIGGIDLRDGTFGVMMRTGTSYIVVQDCEMSNLGGGIGYARSHCTITRNYIHDLKMIVNDPVPTNNDYGATGVIVNGNYNEISYNVMVNCRAVSYDYGYDGGGVEFWGECKNNSIHHNWVEGSKGFMEAGSGANNDFHDNGVYYNVSVNNGRFFYIHCTGTFAVDLANLNVENNTIVEYNGPKDHWMVWGFGGDPPTDEFSAKNNALYIDDDLVMCNKTNFIHQYNCYHLAGGATLGFTLGTGEIEDDPEFVDLSGKDYHLQSTSPARDTGTDLGYTLDFEDESVPDGLYPDMGAYEYQTTGGAAQTLFEITHEGQDFSEYTSVTDADGDLTITGGAALAGTSYGLNVLIDDANTMWGRKDFSAPSTRIVRLRFHIDPDTLTMADTDEFYAVEINGTGGTLWVVKLAYASGIGYRLKWDAYGDGGWHGGGTINIGDTPHYVEILLERATNASSSDGVVTIWVDGVQEGNTTGIDNYDRFNGIEYYRNGAIFGIDYPGTQGNFFIDQIKAIDKNQEIGPHQQSQAAVLMVGYSRRRRTT